jgi:hypothetical protein
MYYVWSATNQCKSIFGWSIFCLRCYMNTVCGINAQNWCRFYEIQVSRLYVAIHFLYKNFLTHKCKKNQQFYAKSHFFPKCMKEKICLLPRIHNWNTFNNLDWKNYDFPSYYLKLKYLKNKHFFIFFCWFTLIKIFVSFLCLNAFQWNFKLWDLGMCTTWAHINQND